MQQASSRNQPASPTTSNDSNVDSLLSGTTTTPASTREPTPVSTPGTSRRGSPLTMTLTPQLTEAASPSLSEGNETNAPPLSSPPLQQARANQDAAHDMSASSTTSSFPEAPMSPAATEHSDAATQETELVSLAGTIADDGVLSKHAKQLRQLRREPVSDSGWLQFTEILEDAIQVVSEAVKLPQLLLTGSRAAPES